MPNAYDPELQLSTHFKLKELLKTSHRSIDNSPPAEVIENLRKLCNELLEPVRVKFGPLWITSGFRSKDLNKKIGGSKDSAHSYGCAADFVPVTEGVTTKQVVSWVKNDSGLLFDQVIDEYSSTSNWVHLGLLRPQHEKAPRKEALVFQGGKYSVFA